MRKTRLKLAGMVAVLTITVAFWRTTAADPMPEPPAAEPAPMGKADLDKADLDVGKFAIETPLKGLLVAPPDPPGEEVTQTLDYVPKEFIERSTKQVVAGSAPVASPAEPTREPADPDRPPLDEFKKVIENPVKLVVSDAVQAVSSTSEQPSAQSPGADFPAPAPMPTTPAGVEAEQPDEEPKNRDRGKALIEVPVKKVVVANSQPVADPAEDPAPDAELDVRKRDVEAPIENVVANDTTRVTTPQFNDVELDETVVRTDSEIDDNASADNPLVDNPRVEPGKVKWHEDFAAACRASGASGKPVLLFQLMGQLDQRFT